MERAVLLGLILGLLPASASGYTYSITYIEDYLYSSVSPPCKVSDLIPWGELEANVVENWLQNAGWSREFRHADAEVKKIDFGTQNSGYGGLDEADFHFHFGHGYKFVTGTWLALWNYSPCFNPGAIVSPDDLEKKWDFNNEWVFLHSCNVLSDVQAWGKALKYTHMIMGFSTTTYTSTDLLERIFQGGN